VDGLLLIDKPAGWTSHDVVARIRSVIRTQTGQKTKVGHTGTLDPFATGLLVLVVGGYTKKAGEFSKLDKTYEAEITLGATSSTGDIEGEITPKSGQVPSKMTLQAILSRFEGEISQIPHKYSAVKVGGQRAYKMARAGKEVKLEPREVTIYSLELLSYEYPKVKIRTKVSSGTYIRSLAEDIGEALGTGAYLSALRRTTVGDCKVEDAQNLQKIGLPAIIAKLSQDKK
jgi:tRNA pseudouridine55 synthase